MTMYSGTAVLTAPALRAPAVLLLVNEADALLSCILESGKFKMQTRRGTTVHVYTWACRLIVFLHGIPEPEYRDCGIRKLTFFMVKPQDRIWVYWYNAACEGRIKSAIILGFDRCSKKNQFEVVPCKERHFFINLSKWLTKIEK